MWQPSFIRTFLIELEYLDHNLQTIIKLVELFSRKLSICFPLHLDKVEKETKF